MSISLIIITKNEAANLDECLTSVQGLVDEIILVDSGSTDATVEIAQKYGAKVTVRPFDSFTLQKGAALALATKEWVFNLDADETVPPH
ncbi:glycosyltransferase involved in cell wall biosynthesis [Elusimicrobium posterum]|uniref:glycosyltransferase family 2 protein n=1 Tax=Elusimicrobium posterum TaxID=3116653 RepID=UPI003C72F2E8